MLESIEKLRKLCAGVKDSGFVSVGCDAVLRITNEIEREISEMQESRLSERVYWQNEIHTILDTLTGQKRFWGCNLEYPLGEGALSPSEIATREIAEHYMKLPVDADGVPIYMGDVVEFGENRNQGIVKALNEHMVIAMHVDDGYTNYAKYGLLWNVDACRHVKPRTVEDVLEELLDEPDWEQSPDSYEDIKRRMIVRYAAELRGMLGGDSE